WGVVLGLNAFGAFGMGQSASTTTHFATGGTFTGLDPLTSGINVTTAGSSTVTGPNGSSAHTSSTLVSNADVAAVTPGTNEFELSAVTTTTTPTNAQYGGVGSTSGGGFVANGPVDMTTTINRSVYYGGVDLT